MELAERGGASAQLRAYALLAFAEAEFFAGRGISWETFERAAGLRDRLRALRKRDLSVRD